MTQTHDMFELYLQLLGNMDEIINLVIFVDKNTLAMFNLDFRSVLGFFLVFNVLSF